MDVLYYLYFPSTQFIQPLIVRQIIGSGLLIVMKTENTLFLIVLRDDVSYIVALHLLIAGHCCWRLGLGHCHRWLPFGYEPVSSIADHPLVLLSEDELIGANNEGNY